MFSWLVDNIYLPNNWEHTNLTCFAEDRFTLIENLLANGPNQFAEGCFEFCRSYETDCRLKFLGSYWR